MKKYVDMLLESMIKHDPSILPLADEYAATENSRPAALQFLNSWRTLTGVNGIQHLFADEAEGQVFFAANVDEHGMPSILYGRIRVEGGRFSEFELSLIRSESDSGFIFAPDEMLLPPHSGWTSPIPDDGRASREELMNVGLAIFDRSKGDYPAADNVPMMEVGGTVYENPDYITMAFGDDKVEKRPPKEKIPLFSAGLDAIRPEVPGARVTVIDEDQGVVVAFATVRGYTCAHPLNGTATCFVPDNMMPAHEKTMVPEMFEGISRFRTTPAVLETVEIMRYHSGKIQASHRLMQMQGVGACSPWER
ncbi:MAG: hypothetical protein FWG03_08540 [Clostridiales bacterium]|nr:hypothetical protein [Clostridiales bacterium]